MQLESLQLIKQLRVKLDFSPSATVTPSASL